MNEQIQPEITKMFSITIQVTYPQLLWSEKKALEQTKKYSKKISRSEVIRDLVQEAMDSEQV